MAEAYLDFYFSEDASNSMTNAVHATIDKYSCPYFPKG